MIIKVTEEITNKNFTVNELLNENRILKIKLQEAENFINELQSKTDNVPAMEDRNITLKGGNYSYRVFIERMKEGAVTINPAGVISYCNSSFSEMLDYSSENLIGVNICDFIDPAKREYFNHLIISGFNENSKGEIELISNTGERILVNISLSRLEIENEEEICIAITDLRERKAAEEKLKQAHAELERRVKERTKELEEINRMLVNEIHERKRTRVEIEAALREKEVMLKEIHHRVKNNLQIISSLLNLQSAYVNHKNAAEILRESQNRVRSMALIHERLYQGKSMSMIDFGSYIRELVEHLHASYDSGNAGIKIQIKTDNISLNIDKAIILGLIINEIVSNSFKHAFDGIENGLVEITAAEEQNNIIQLMISDNGKGMPSNLDYQNSNSLGMQLIITLVDQIGATIKTHNENGTKYILRLSR